MSTSSLNRVAAQLGTLALGSLLMLTACARERRPEVGDDQYRPLYGNRENTKPEARGTIRGDFQWASASPTFSVAAARWEEFLKTHDPPGREFEDGLHASYVAAAKYELVRLYYLMGKREDGDALLRRLDPVGWTK